MEIERITAAVKRHEWTPEVFERTEAILRYQGGDIFNTLRRELLPEEYEAFDRSLDVQVSRLRKIIEPDPSKPRYLQTVWGLGYVFIPDGASDAQDKK